MQFGIFFIYLFISKKKNILRDPYPYQYFKKFVVEPIQRNKQNRK